MNAPIWNFNDDKLKFNTNWSNKPNENYGSTSGFVPVYHFLKKTSPLMKGGVFLDRTSPAS